MILQLAILKNNKNNSLFQQGTKQKIFMQPILKNNLLKLEQICRKHYVKRLHAFGSVCSGNFNEKSDIDLIIAFEPRYFNGYVDNFFSLEDKLKKLFNRKVDLVTEETIQNPYFIKVVNKTKKSIYE